MARNGSGTYTAPANSWNPASPETPILSDDWNQTLDDMSQALTQSLASDGQTPTTAVIPFAQGISVSSGLLTAPSIAPTGDANTGVYFPAADQMSLVCGGVAAVVMTSSGVTFPLAVTFSGSPAISGNLTVTGNLTVNGNTTIGNASGDTLTVTATSTFGGNLTANGTATFTSTVTVPDASFTNAKLANMATQTIKGRTTAGSGAPEDLSAAQATAILNAVVGDSGSGGTKGLVPAPAAGDAAAKKYLTADGTWSNELKAWGVFNGSDGSTVVARNISCTNGSPSIYDFTFGTALANTNYAIFIYPHDAGSSDYFFQPTVLAKTTSGFQIQTVASISGTPGGAEPATINVQVIA